MAIVIDKNTNVKKFLEEQGYKFPCGGAGLCGRCKVIAKDLEITARDRVFFSEAELQEGYRLACDKVTNKSVYLEPLFAKKASIKKPSDPGVIIFLEKDLYHIYLIGDETIIDSYIGKTPLLDKIALQSALGSETIELYEEYGLAIVDSIMILGEYEYIKALENENTNMEGTMNAKLFSMPSLDVYMPKFVDKKFNHLLLYAMDLEENTALVVKDYLIVKNDTFFVYQIKDGKIKGNISIKDNNILNETLNISNIYVLKSDASSSKEYADYAAYDVDLAQKALNVYQVFRQRNRYEYQLENATLHLAD